MLENYTLIICLSNLGRSELAGGTVFCMDELQEWPQCGGTVEPLIMNQEFESTHFDMFSLASYSGSSRLSFIGWEVATNIYRGTCAYTWAEASHNYVPFNTFVCCNYSMKPIWFSAPLSILKDEFLCSRNALLICPSVSKVWATHALSTTSYHL